MKFYLRDWLINVVLSLIVYFLSLKYGLFDLFIDFLLSYRHFKLGEFFLVYLTFSLGVLIINYRRRERRRMNKLLIDPLTGLYNRKKFEKVIQRVFSKSDFKRKRYVSLFYIDINKFKKINDDFGHCVGDKFLSVVGSRIKKNLKFGDDLVFRLGGDEFAVVLNFKGYIKRRKSFDNLKDSKRLRSLKGNTGLGGYKDYKEFKRINVKVAKRLSKLLSLNCEIDGNRIDFVSASVGVVTNSLSSEIKSVEDFVCKADRAMYYAKRNGLDYVFFEDIPVDDREVCCKV